MTIKDPEATTTKVNYLLYADYKNEMFKIYSMYFGRIHIKQSHNIATIQIEDIFIPRQLELKCTHVCSVALIFCKFCELIFKFLLLYVLKIRYLFVNICKLPSTIFAQTAKYIPSITITIIKHIQRSRGIMQILFFISSGE